MSLTGESTPTVPTATAPHRGRNAWIVAASVVAAIVVPIPLSFALGPVDSWARWSATLVIETAVCALCGYVPTARFGVSTRAIRLGALVLALVTALPEFLVVGGFDPGMNGAVFFAAVLLPIVGYLLGGLAGERRRGARATTART